LIIVITVFVLTGIILLVLLTKSRPSEPTCSGNGAYDSIGKKCVCNANWSGTDCDTCKGNWSGTDCDTCKGNWSGTDCDTCKSNWGGTDCDTCNANWSGTDCEQTTILFAALFNNSTIWKSSDYGLNWVQTNNTANFIPLSISKSSKIFVTVGYIRDLSSNAVYYSNDVGSTWNKSTTTDTNIITIGRGVTYSESLKLFLAVGDNNGFSQNPTIAFSSDGNIWEGVIKSGDIFSTGYGVVFGNNIFVAVGFKNDAASNSIAVSDATGKGWKVVTNSIFTIGCGITWNGKIFVAVGQGNFSIAWSSDGTNWNGVANSNNLFTTGSGVAWSDKLKIFVAVGMGTNTIAYSTDDTGTTWNFVPDSENIISVGRCVKWDTNSEKFLVGGNPVKNKSGIVFSSDVKNWSNSTTIITVPVYSIA
jgi:hypothetical protein